MKKSSKDDIGKTFDVEFEKKIFNYLWREMVIVLFIKKIDMEQRNQKATQPSYLGLSWYTEDH